MRALKWIVGLPLALLLAAFLYFLVTTSPEKSRAYGNLHYAEDECEKMMSDSQPGAERRMTRAMCDQLRARLEHKSRETK